MSDVNRSVISGRLGQKPELRHTAKGTPVTNLVIASNRSYYGTSDEKQEETTWVKVVVWGGNAEACAKFLDKGSRVIVDGRMQQHKFVSKDTKEEHSYLQLVADSVTFLSSKSPSQASVNEDLDDDDDIPIDEDEQ